jgi:formylglycine-generating enzyme required for sulfatase activity
MRGLVLAALLLVACTVAGDRLDGISDGDHCTNGVQDADESDDDCGGADCAKCPPDQACKTSADCTSGVCTEEDGFKYCQCPADMVSHVRPEDERTFCIDKLEVSAGQYDAYLKSCDPPGSCASDCDGAWTVTIPVNDPEADCTPDKYDPEGFPNRPVVCVHLCDAIAYCNAHGKRLCGDYIDDSLPATLTADPNVSEWFNACSQSGSAAYPYGNTFEPTFCNGSGAVADVGSFQQCGAPGGDLLDMSGNVWEWEAAYDETQDECVIRGGSFYSTETSLTCSSKLLEDCEGYSDDIGFRCCSG